MRTVGEKLAGVIIGAALGLGVALALSDAVSSLVLGGIFIGALTGLTAACVVHGQLRGAAACLVILVLFMLSFEGKRAGFSSALMGGMLVLAGIMVAFLLSAYALRNFHDGNESRAFQHQLDLLMTRHAQIPKLDITVVYDFLPEKHQVFDLQQIKTHDDKLVSAQIAVWYSLSFLSEGNSRHTMPCESQQQLANCLAMSRAERETELEKTLQSRFQQIFGAYYANTVCTGQDFACYEKQITQLTNDKMHCCGISLSSLVIRSVREQV
jgi:hypothetical protein